MKLKRSLALLTGLGLLLSGCAGPQFNQNKDKSLEKVRALQKDFNFPGFAAEEVVEGNWNFETGGNPNASFKVKVDPSISILDACQTANDYALSLTTEALSFFPRSDVTESNAVVNCIADYLDQYSQGFRWNGVLSSGETFKVEIFSNDELSLLISTNFQDGGASEEDMGLEIIPQNMVLTEYLDSFQSYRNKHSISLYTLATLKAANLVTESEQIKISPIADSDGFVRKISVRYTENKFDQCFSAMPWDSKTWGMADPGPSYPSYGVSSIEKLTNFGSYVSNSDCK